MEQDESLGTQIVVAVVVAILSFLLFCVLRIRFRTHQDHVSATINNEVWYKKAVEAEDANARYRFTESRMKKALATLGGHRKSTKTEGKGKDFDAIIIGSGPASMAAAATLSKIGYSCVIFEQGEQLGGGAHVFSEKNFEFETGVHYIGHDSQMEELLQFLTCGRIELADIGSPVSTQEWSKKAGNDGMGTMYDDIVIEGMSYPYVAGFDNLEGMLRARFPSAEDGARISKFLSKLKLTQSDKYKQDAAMFFRLKVVELLPAWLRLQLQKILGASFFKMTQITTEEMLLECGVNPSSLLGAVLIGQYGDAGCRPDRCSAMMTLGVTGHYMQGSKYPVGGSGAIPRKMHTVVLAGGGRAFVQASVDRLLVEGSTGPATSGQIRATGVVVNGVEVRAPLVISGMSAMSSFEMISKIPGLGPATREDSYAGAALSRIRECTEQSVAFIFLFLGLEVDPDAPSEDAQSDSRAHNTWLYPARHFTKMEEDIDKNDPWSRPMPMFVASGSAKDVGWAEKHGGQRKTVVVLSQCPYKWVERWQDLDPNVRDADSEYQEFKEAYKKAAMEQGFRKVFPDLEPYIVHSTVGTPLSTNHFLATRRGECYGLAATPERWLVPDLAPHTAVKGFLLTGQDILTLGLSGALSAGYLTANAAAGYGCWENALLQRDIIQDLGLKPIY